jgi:hypothetical protein
MGDRLGTLGQDAHSGTWLPREEPGQRLTDVVDGFKMGGSDCRLEHVLRAASRIVHQRDFLVVGSAAILAC